MRGDKTQKILQLVYDLFYRSGGTWPLLGDLQRELNRQGNSGMDAARIVQRIPVTLLTSGIQHESRIREWRTFAWP